MLEYIHMLYDYNYWGNQRVLDASTHLSQDELDAPPTNGYPGLRATLVHTMNAEWIWRERGQNHSPEAALNERDFPTLDSLRARWLQEEQATRAFLATLTESTLADHLTYQNFKGQTCTLPLWQMLVHVVNHGTQHRSEVAFMLTTLEHSPGDLDMSVFLSQRSQQV